MYDCIGLWSIYDCIVFLNYILIVWYGQRRLLEINSIEYYNYCNYLPNQLSRGHMHEQLDSTIQFDECV
jgi:hypothetical protein